MQHAKRIAIASIATVLIGLIALQSFSTPVDAASILESENRALAAIGESFSIDARGEIFLLREDYESRALTKMHFEFSVVRNGSWGVMFEVTAGYFIANTTKFTISEGVGFAGRPSNIGFNTTIVFGFRMNLTDTLGKSAQVGFLGGVLRNQDSRPILLMRGHTTIGDLSYSLIQRGIIRRI
jgi:hypothetical protein